MTAQQLREKAEAVIASLDTTVSLGAYDKACKEFGQAATPDAILALIDQLKAVQKVLYCCKEEMVDLIEDPGRSFKPRDIIKAIDTALNPAREDVK